MVKGSGSGWFRRKGGRLLYCWYNDAGRERTKAVGDASMTDAEAWIEVANLDLNKQVGKPDPKNAKFGGVLDHWLAYGKTKTGEEKDDSTKETDERNARKHLSHWADRVAKDIEPLEIQQWLDEQSYGMRSKLRSMMSAVYRHGQKFGFIPRGEECNPMKLVSAPTKTDYEAVQLSGKEAALVIRQIADPLVKVLVILIAVTGMRISEALALAWSDVDSVRQRIRIRRKWGRKGYGPPKSLMSKRPVEMTAGLAAVLQSWRQETMYADDGDLLFPSEKMDGEQPRSAGMLVEDYVRPAAIAAGVLEIRDGLEYYDGEPVERFGFHNLRHGLATWLAENGTSPEVIARMLRWSKTDMMVHYVHAQKAARDAQERYIAELEIAPGEHCGSALRVQ